MWLGLWLLAACTPDSSPNHLGGLPTGDTSVAPTGDTAPVTAPPSLAITQPAGIRDLRADTDADATLRWTRRRDGLVIDGPVVSALEVFPGDTWDVVATGPRGTATAEHVVAPAPGGNVLFVVIDDVGIDHFGAYGVGVDPPQTPRMDALADEGVRFRQAYASPNCSPTRGELMSGRHARRTGLGWIVDTGHRAGELPIDAVTLPEALRTARSDPWANTALGKWHLAGPEADDYLTHANRSGFDRFAGTWGNPIYRAGYGYVKWDKLVDGVEHETEGYLTTDLVDEALLHIASLPEPWFLYVAFHAAHTPLSEPPAELIHTPLPKNPDENVLFNATVEALDTELGRLLDGIPAGVRADTTLPSTPPAPRAPPSSRACGCRWWSPAPTWPRAPSRTASCTWSTCSPWWARSPACPSPAPTPPSPSPKTAPCSTARQCFPCSPTPRPQVAAGPTARASPPTAPRPTPPTCAASTKAAGPSLPGPGRPPR